MAIFSSRTQPETVTPRRRSEPGPTEPTLDELEAIVSTGLDSVANVGLALQAIKDRELYRPQYDSWPTYLDARWKLGLDYANKLIVAGGIVLKLRAAGLPEPSAVSHTRELAKVKPEAVTQVWTDTLDEVGTVDNVTAETIAKHATKHRKRKARRKAPAAIRLKGKNWALVLTRKTADVDPIAILAEATEQLAQRAAKKAA
jgi:hypothetical protein